MAAESNACRTKAARPAQTLMSVWWASKLSAITALPSGRSW